MKITTSRGYTLVELMIAVGLFAIIMMLVSGSYFMMINVSRQAQGIATGVNSLSFALETMMRTIRTSTNYYCPTGTYLTVIDQYGHTVRYGWGSGGVITQKIDSAAAVPLTDSSIYVDTIDFRPTGLDPYSVGNDKKQARVTIVVGGGLTARPGTYFTIETSATMRGTDI